MSTEHNFNGQKCVVSENADGSISFNIPTREHNRLYVKEKTLYVESHNLLTGKKVVDRHTYKDAKQAAFMMKVAVNKFKQTFGA